MYHYFAAKDDLLYEIYHRLLALQTARLERLAGGAGTPEERLRAAAIDVIETSCAHLDEADRLLPLDAPAARGQAQGRTRRAAPLPRAVPLARGGGAAAGDLPPGRPGRPGGQLLLRCGPPDQYLVASGRRAGRPRRSASTTSACSSTDCAVRGKRRRRRARASGYRTGHRCQTGGMQRKMSLDALAREHAKRAGSDTTGRSSSTVYGGHERVLRQTLIAIVSGRSMAEHENPGEATMLVLRRPVRLVANGDDWEGRSGDLLVIPDSRHSDRGRRGLRHPADRRQDRVLSRAVDRWVPT